MDRDTGKHHTACNGTEQRTDERNETTAAISPTRAVEEPSTFALLPPLPCECAWSLVVILLTFLYVVTE